MSNQILFGSLAIQPIKSRITSALRAYNNTWRAFAPPKQIGEAIRIHPQNLQESYIQEAWHGSSLKMWEHQILEGQVHNQTKNLFFGDINLATQYALIHTDPILIHLKIKSGVIRTCETYGTDYVQGESPSEVVIARAYHVNKAYIQFANNANRPKLSYVYKTAAKAAIRELIRRDRYRM